MGLVNEAIALDRESGEAYVERGYINLYFGVAEADADMRRGIELAPNRRAATKDLQRSCFRASHGAEKRSRCWKRRAGSIPWTSASMSSRPLYLEWGAGDYAGGGSDSAARTRARPAVRTSTRATRRHTLGGTGPARRSRGARRAGRSTRSWK